MPVTDQDAAYVSWKTHFESKNDTVSQEFCDPFYGGFSADLKAKFAYFRAVSKPRISVIRSA